jgi:hypothetical protein
VIGEAASPERMSEVLRLCTALADRAFDTQTMGQTVPADQAIALAKAASLLQDHGVKWPPMLTHVMHELADKNGGTAPAEPAEPLKGIDLQGLTGFLTDLWKEKVRS